MTRYFAILTIILLTFSCNNTEKKPEVKPDYTAELFGLMQGSYNSEIQSQVDSTYYNISLHMYPIWQGKGNYLYVEQALNSMQDRPYRQRIYEVTQLNDSTYSSAIYTIAADSLWIGKWKSPKDFDALLITDVTKKEGCEVLLERIEPNYYAGETGDKTCHSSMRGASYAMSEVEILEDKIISWDRGFDANDEHVWGAEKAGYIFNKLD